MLSTILIEVSVEPITVCPVKKILNYRQNVGNFVVNIARFI